MTRKQLNLIKNAKILTPIDMLRELSIVDIMEFDYFNNQKYNDEMIKILLNLQSEIEELSYEITKEKLGF